MAGVPSGPWRVVPGTASGSRAGPFDSTIAQFGALYAALARGGQDVARARELPVWVVGELFTDDEPPSDGPLPHPQPGLRSGRSEPSALLRERVAAARAAASGGPGSE